MPTAAIISKPNKPELKELICGVVDWLEGHGYQVVLDPESLVLGLPASDGGPAEPPGTGPVGWRVGKTPA